MRKFLKRPGALPLIADLMFPEVAGYPEVKYGMMNMLVNQWDGPTRERIHILLYGKPGTGKTALMEPLETNYNALYISMDATAASLRGDGRREDHGAKIFNECDGEIICIDDIEKMKDMDLLRDVMEKGIYTVTKNGTHVEYDGHCRIVAATNDIKRMPYPIRSRFDLVYMFKFPTLDQSMNIVRQMLHADTEKPNPGPFLSHYIALAKSHEPEIIEPDHIEDRFQNYFENYGTPTDDGEPGGKEGRWVAGIFRLAKSISRLNLENLGPEQIAQALEMKHTSDEVLRNLS